LTQQKYIDKILNQFDANNKTKIAKTPISKEYIEMERYIHIEQPKYDKTKYLQLLGSLSYLANHTRPDILYAVNVCAQKSSVPCVSDYKALIRILGYIKDTKNYCLQYDKNIDDMKLYCYVDASHNCYEDGKGHFGFTLRLGKHNGSFYTKSNKLRMVTLSSAESEYVALSEAVAVVFQIQQLLKDLGIAVPKPAIIFEDNMSAIQIGTGKVVSKRTKHVNVKYHFVKEASDLQHIKIVYCSTEDMVADLLTKGFFSTRCKELTFKLLNFEDGE
jgi:hypothetical protein